MRHLSEHNRLKIHALHPILSETGRLFLRNAMEAELNRDKTRNHRNWLFCRLKCAGAGREAAMVVYDEYVGRK